MKLSLVFVALPPLWLALLPGASGARGVRQAGADKQPMLLRQQETQTSSTASSVGVDQTTSAPLLLTLLKDLRTEAEAGIELSNAMGEWCHDARGQKAGMVDDLKRQLDEADNNVRQVTLDVKRLASESSLVNSTTQDKMQQLRDAAATAKEASFELQGEREQLQSLLDATQHAIQLVEVRSDSEDDQQAGAAAGHDMNSELISNLAQLQRMADGQGGSLHESMSLSRMRSHELKRSLVTLRDKLRDALGESAQERQEIEQKEWIFSDHLNSSLMEIQSQIAAIKMQATQRNREHLRLQSRARDLKALLGVVSASQAATEAACSEEQSRRGESSQLIKAESFIVRSMLKQGPAGLSASASGPPSFLQVQERSGSREVERAVDDLESMARRFPSEAQWYDDGARKLALLRERSRGSEQGETEGATGSRDDPHSALRNIKRFVAASSEGGRPGAAGQSLGKQAAKRPRSADDELGGMYANLFERVRTKEQVISSQSSRCAALLRDAAADQAALSRSLKRVDAKKRILQASLSEYEQAQVYDKVQAKQVASLTERLAALSQQAGSLAAKSRRSLVGHAEELMDLAGDLGTQRGGDEQRTAQMVRSLAQKVDSHQHALLQQQARLLERKKAVDAADAELLSMLQVDAERNRRRLSRLQAEGQLLSGLGYAKAHDHELSSRYEEISRKLCSAEGMARLDKKDRELRREEQVLQASSTQGSQSSHRA